MADANETSDPALERVNRNMARIDSEHRAAKLEIYRRSFNDTLDTIHEILDGREPSSPAVQEDFERIRDAVEETTQNPKFPPIDASRVRTIHGLAFLNQINEQIQQVHSRLSRFERDITIEDVTNA